jgi:hypothetical protein
MIRKLLITLLAVTIPATHAAAQTLTESFNREASRAAAAQSPRAGRYENPYETPGFVLVGLGGAIAVLGLLNPTGVDCTSRDTVSAYSVNCGATHSKVALIGGAGLAGVGGYLLWKGQQQSTRAPEIVPTYRGIAIRQRVRW